MQKQREVRKKKVREKVEAGLRNKIDMIISNAFHLKT